MHTPLPLLYSPRVRDALHLAEHAHRGVTRKAGGVPYVLHVITVSSVLSAAGADDDLIIAAYLHDVVEDTSTTLLEIADTFGGRVATLVAGVTKDDSLPKAARLQHTEDIMSSAGTDIDIVALKGADLVANLSDIVFDCQKHGQDHVTIVFGNEEKALAKLEHYMRLGSIIQDRLDKAQMYPVVTAHLLARQGQIQVLYNNLVSTKS